MAEFPLERYAPVGGPFIVLFLFIAVRVAYFLWYLINSLHIGSRCNSISFFMQTKHYSRIALKVILKLNYLIYITSRSGRILCIFKVESFRVITRSVLICFTPKRLNFNYHGAA